MDIEDFGIKPKIENENLMKSFVNDFISMVGNFNIKPTNGQINDTLLILRRRYHLNPSKCQIRYIYNKYFQHIQINNIISHYMIKSAVRSMSGVLVSTIVLRPDVFSCPKKCAYCPTETNLDGVPTQPKSYLSSEPAMMRALQYNFDVCGQMWDRIKSYIYTGNIQQNSTSSKIEVILSGGTWESYPYDYRNQVMNEIYWAANTFGQTTQRPMLSLEEEININETTNYRVIGLTIETRPDFITPTSIRDYRRWGVTRVQVGVQHYDDNILDGIMRDCYTIDTIKAIMLLKQTGFKVVCHLMPDLFGSSPELDKWMFDQAINNPDLQFDDVKVYPCAVCKSSDPNLIVSSDIANWYRDGIFKPYAETDLNLLIDVLTYYKKKVQPWVRIERLVRDIPKKSIEAGYDKISNLRQYIQDKMKKDGDICHCIRCMEARGNEQINQKLVVRKYIASGGNEYFISVESNTWSWSYIWFLIIHYISLCIGNYTWWSGNLNTYNGLSGFCRLRIDKKAGGNCIDELKNCAMIREVHVYGHSIGVNMNVNTKSSQHKGHGQMMIKVAEQIAVQNGYSKIAVIAGVGTRQYYENKCGYHREGTYMVKFLDKEMNQYQKNRINNSIFWIFIIIAIIVAKYF